MSCVNSEKLQHLLDVDNSKSYIQSLKQVLSGCKKDENYTDNFAEIAESVAVIYYKCKPKNPVRKVLISFIEDLESGDKSVVRKCLQNHLEEQLETLIEMNDLSNIRNRVDTVSSLMDNFSTGEECLATVSLKVLKMLAQALSCFLQHFRETLSPVQINEIMHHCLATIQTSNRLLHKSVAMTTYMADETELHEIITEYLESDVTILYKDDFLSDCRCGCAMNIALLLKIVTADKMPLAVTKLMFASVIPSCDLPPFSLPDWLTHSKITMSEVSSLPIISQLCLIFGLLAKLDLEELLVEISPQKTLMTSVFLPQLLMFSKKCSDTANKVLLAKTMTLWTNRMCFGLENKLIPSHLRPSLTDRGSTVRDILQYVWTTWDDQIDVIRQNAKNTFENTIKIHLLASQSDAKSDEYILNVTKELFSVGWSNKGKYGAVASIVTVLGMSCVLELHPLLAEELIQQLKEQMSASQASDLYDRLCRHHLAECVLKEKTEPDCQKTWLMLWCQPVISALCGDHKQQKTTIIEYILPKLLKINKTVLPFLIEQLTVRETPSSNETCALIMCLRRARCLGQLHHSLESSASGDKTLWYGLVNVDVLKYALTSLDDQVRLDAFALLCENNKTTEPISNLEFDLMRYFLPFNLNNQSPAFRQHLLSYIQKLFYRMKESWQTFVRQTKNKKDEKMMDKVVTNMATYQNFLHWLQTLMFGSIHLGSSFPRRTTCLMILSLVVDSAEQMKHSDTDQLFMSVYELGDKYRQTLLDCLVDTFEENKMAAIKILSACMRHGFGFQSQDAVESLFKSALELSTSNKPQDCTTAAYLFRYLLQQPSILLVMNTSAANMVANDNPMIDRSPSLLLLSILQMLLKDELKDARKSLTLAAANRPIYPTLHCVRYILSDVNFKSVSVDFLQSWRKLLDDLIHLCLELSKVVSPVVQASSPEGNVPLEILKSLHLDTEFDKSDTSHLVSKTSDKIVTLMPEFLVVCCWRCVKEVSLLFGHICQNIPITDSEADTGFINKQQLLLIGDYFKNQLLESIHRGAFELAYAGFVQMCDMLWRSSVKDLHQLPSQWLTAIMSDIKGNNSNLCATRRSAGVPFYVQALVSTEPSLTGRTCFKSAITTFLSLSLKSGETTDAQVHSLNILRALFRDTRLGEDVSPYITDGLMAAILGFKSNSWAVRNSSTLLLSALMTRIFGVKRSKDESSISKKNCQTGRAFFHRYPALYQFLLQELTEATRNIDCSEHIQLHPSLYPVLMVLGRLFPSSLEGTDTNLSLSAFIPLIIKCASSPVYKTRMMAARALQPLVQKDQLISVIIQLMQLLPTSPASEMKQSCLHGILLQIEHLLMMVHNSKNDFLHKHTLHSVITSWMLCLWLISRSNVCFMTRKSALDICDLLLSLDQQPHTSFLQSVLNTIQLELSQERNLTRVTSLSLAQPFVHEFMTTVTKLYFKYLENIPLKEKEMTKNVLENPEIQNISSLNETENCVTKDFLETSNIQGSSLNPEEAHSVTANVPETSEICGASMQKEIEDSVMSLLCSKFYEVRLETLRILSHHFCQDAAKENEQVSEVSFFNPRIVRYCQSEKIFQELLTMALSRESHHSCIAMVFETLKNYPGIHSLINSKNVMEIFRLLLKRLKNEKRSEVQSSIIAFSGAALCAVYTYLKQERRSELYDCLTQWCDCIMNSTQSEQSADLQISCAQAVHDNAIILLVDPHSILGSLTFSVWEVVINLLQEDDLEVKGTMSSILPLLDDHNHFTDVQPTFALKSLVARMVVIHGKRNKVECKRTLIKWIQDCDSACKDQEERLFDRGEINTYRENPLFAQLIAEQLEKIIHTAGKSAGDSKSTDDSVNKIKQDSVDCYDSVLDNNFNAAGDINLTSAPVETSASNMDKNSVSATDARNSSSAADASFELSVDSAVDADSRSSMDKNSSSSIDDSSESHFNDHSTVEDHTRPVITDPETESLLSGLLKYFSLKLTNMDVVTPVSPFRDSVLYEASLKTLMIAATVIRCTRSVSKTGTLQEQHLQLLHALKSKCQPLHIILEGLL